METGRNSFGSEGNCSYCTAIPLLYLAMRLVELY